MPRERPVIMSLSPGGCSLPLSHLFTPGYDEHIKFNKIVQIFKLFRMYQISTLKTNCDTIYSKLIANTRGNHILHHPGGSYHLSPITSETESYWSGDGDWSSSDYRDWVFNMWTWSVTDCTVVWFLTCVNTHVFIQITFCWAYFTACCTLVSYVSSMSTHVNI